MANDSFIELHKYIIISKMNSELFEKLRERQEAMGAQLG